MKMKLHLKGPGKKSHLTTALPWSLITFFYLCTAFEQNGPVAQLDRATAF